MSDSTASISPFDAEAIIESLRAGIPPAGRLREFTVGRRHEIERLESTLEDQRDSALLVQANYGAGKTHLLRLLREMAFEKGYAVALVTVDSKAGVRFNRMDQIAGAVMRDIELDASTPPGVWNVFEAFGELEVEDLAPGPQQIYKRITANGRWDMSSELESPGLYVALRTWIHVTASNARHRIQDWLSYPWEYTSNRKELYSYLIETLPPSVRDPRPDSEFYSDGVFVFNAGGHRQAWEALGDIDKLVRVCGRRGLILLFDEFEDVIQNMNNIRLEQAAFVNLFRLFNGQDFPGRSYFAVTPEFSYKCRERLFDKFVYSFPVERFDELERLEMTPIEAEDFGVLASLIRSVHGRAYEWDADNEYADHEVEDLVTSLFANTSADQVRQAVEGLVESLDQRLDD